MFKPFNTLLILILLAVVTIPAAGASYNVSLETMPSTILADGRSYSQIMVTVTESNGLPVADGTEVRFTTTAGSITPAARTGAGRASAILTSATSPQIAMITASAAGITTSAQVEFASSAEDISSGPRTVRMKGGSIAYSIERDTALGNDDVTVEYRGLTIKATNAQVCEALSTLRAQGKVSIEQGGKKIEADAFTCDLRTNHCRALKSGDVSTVSTFDVDKFDRVKDSSALVDPSEFAPLASDGTKTWIVSRRLAIFPGEKIQFFRAAIFLGGSRIIQMPYYSYSYQDRESILQQVKYTSRNGLLVDLPLYYHMADSGSGAFKLRYSGAGSDYGGYFQPRKGMSLGLEQAYSNNENTEGRVFVDSVTDATRSFELAHHTEFGEAANSGRLDLTARYQPTSTFAKGVYNTGLNMNGGLGKYCYTLNGYFGGSQIRQYNFLDPTSEQYMGQSDGSISATLRPRQPLFASRAMSMTPSFSFGYGRTGYMPGRPSNPSLYQTLGMSFNSSLSRNQGLGFGYDGSTALTTTARGDMGVGLRTGVNMRKNWRGGGLGLTYTLNLQGGNVGTLYSPSKHTIGATMFLASGSKWNWNANLGYGLDTGQMNAYSAASYHISRLWSFRSNYSLYLYKFASNGLTSVSRVSYFKAGIYRPIGPYEIGIAYSPDGQDYTMNSHKRLWFEIGASGF